MNAQRAGSRLRWLQALLAALAFGCGGDEPAGSAASEAPGSRREPRAGSMAGAAAGSAVGGGGGSGGRAGHRADGRPAPQPDDAGAVEPPPIDAGPLEPAHDGGDSGPPVGEPELADEILTQRYDNARTGAHLAERQLTPARVSELRLLGSWPVDGQVYAQVLVASDVEGGAGRRSLAIVATMNNSVFAFDADDPTPAGLVWQQGQVGELGMPLFCARNIGGPNGILSTPVIDPAKRHLFLVARDCDPDYPPEAPSCEHRLFQLDLATGAIERSVTIEGEVAVADGGEPSSIRFEPSAHWNRPALLLSGDQLVVAFGAGPAGNQHEEDFVYHGWVFRYDVRDLDRAPEVYCTTPRGRGGSVWQAGSGPAADGAAVYLTGSNGIQADNLTHPPEDWPAAPIGQEDSVIRLRWDEPLPSPTQHVVQYADTRDYTAAGNVFQHMESGDNGFGSSGPMLIPDSRSLLVGTKAGLVYLLDRDSLQPRHEPLSPFDRLPLQPGHSLYLHSWWGLPVITQSFVFWRIDTEADGDRYGYAYAWPSEDVLRSFRYDYETDRVELLATAGVPAIRGGGNLILSAFGDARDTGLLWAATRSPSKDAPAGELWAFDPITLEVLFRAETPAWAKFNPPTVARGRVFLPSTAADAPEAQILVYGL